MRSAPTSSSATPASAPRRIILYTLLVPILLATAVGIHAKWQLTSGLVTSAAAPPFPATTPVSSVHGPYRAEILDSEENRVVMGERAGPPPIVVGPHGQHTATVIFSHGLGHTGEGWRSFARSLSPRFPHIKFVLPTAPIRMVTVAGRPMNAWFDVIAFGTSDPSQEDRQGMLRALEGINELVQSEVDAGVPESRIVVGGFSQGCAISLLLAVTTERKLAGILGLSGRLMMVDKLAEMQSTMSKALPVFWGHGTEDQMISMEKAQTAVKVLRGLGIEKVEFHIYQGMGHSACPEEVADIEAFLKKVLP